MRADLAAARDLAVVAAAISARNAAENAGLLACPDATVMRARASAALCRARRLAGCAA